MQLSLRALVLFLVATVWCAGCGGSERQGTATSAPATGKPPAKMTKEQKSNKAAVEMP